MIAKLKGKVEYLAGNYVVLDISGVGYKIYLSPYTIGKMAGKKDVEIFTHTYVREDSLDLYGFLTQEELDMFDLLISVSGIGPKAGMSILSIATPKTIQAAILNEDSSILTRVSGVGKKTAERVILELQNKIADMPESEKEGLRTDSDAIEGLMAMGYSQVQAREALKQVPKDIKDIGERIKQALRNLGK